MDKKQEIKINEEIFPYLECLSLVKNQSIERIINSILQRDLKPLIEQLNSV